MVGYEWNLMGGYEWNLMEGYEGNLVEGYEGNLMVGYKWYLMVSLGQVEIIPIRTKVHKDGIRTPPRIFILRGQEFRKVECDGYRTKRSLPNEKNRTAILAG